MQVRAVSEVGEKALRHNAHATKTLMLRCWRRQTAPGWIRPPFLLPSRVLLINGGNVRARLEGGGEGRRLTRAVIDSGFSVSSRFARSQRGTPTIRECHGR